MIDMMRSPDGEMIIKGTDDEIATIAAVIVTASMRRGDPVSDENKGHLDLLRRMGGEIMVAATRMGIEQRRQSRAE
jgi:hypothetical protein